MRHNMEETTKNLVETAIEAGVSLGEIKVIEEGKHEKTRIMVPKGLKLFELETQTGPAIKSGAKTFADTKSFCEYTNKHKVEGETVILASENTGKIKVVFDDHGKETPRFGKFVAVLDLGFSSQFLVWLKGSYNHAEKKHSQADFADFIEDNRTDLLVGTAKKEGEEIKTITGLELTDMVNNLQLSSEVNLVSKRTPHNDEMQYSYEVKDSGVKQSFTLPRSIFLAIPIYKRGDLFQVELRLRSSGRGGEPRFWYLIDKLDDLKEKAFDMICKRIKKGNAGSESDEEKQFEGTEIEVWKGVV